MVKTKSFSNVSFINIISSEESILSIFAGLQLIFRFLFWIIYLVRVASNSLRRLGQVYLNLTRNDLMEVKIYFSTGMCSICLEKN